MISSFEFQYLGVHGWLVRSGEHRILIDPHVTKRLAFLTRKTPAIFDPEEFHKVTHVIVTNPRAGRLNLHTYKFLKLKHTQFYVPPGCAAPLQRHYGFTVNEISEPQSITIGESTFRFIPAHHRCLRFLKTHSLSLLVEVIHHGQTLLFGSDTAKSSYLHPDFLVASPVWVTFPAVFGAGPIAGMTRLTPSESLALVSEWTGTRFLATGHEGFQGPGFSAAAFQKLWESEITKNPELKERVIFPRTGETFHLEETETGI